MNIFSHILLTRFNVSCEWGRGIVPGVEWMKRRFQLFETFTIPSLQSQTNRNFKWLVFFHVSTPDEFRTKIADLARRGDFIARYVDRINLCDPFPAHGIMPFIEAARDEDSEFLITSRIDNDDAIS